MAPASAWERPRARTAREGGCARAESTGTCAPSTVDPPHTPLIHRVEIYRVAEFTAIKLYIWLDFLLDIYRRWTMRITWETLGQAGLFARRT